MSGSNIIRTSAPGKLMLFGEHAVLYGYPCIVTAVTPRAYVTLTPREDDRILVESDLGRYTGRVGAVSVEKPLTFVTAAIRQIAPSRGFNLRISCDFPADVGLGSSAAVTVSVVAALHRYTMDGISEPKDIFNESLKVVHSVQGAGSGADLAASTFGGVLYLKAGGQRLRPLNCRPEIVAIYSGAKEKTAAVIANVRQAAEQEPRKFERIFGNIGDVVEKAAVALELGNWPEVGRLMLDNQLLMAEMGVSNEALDRIINELCEDMGIFGAKISGSGLGDCAWGLGKLKGHAIPGALDLACDATGFRIG